MNQTKTYIASKTVRRQPDTAEAVRIRLMPDTTPTLTISVCVGPVTSASTLSVIHVDFGPDSEGFEIQTRLDGEPGAWNQPPIVVAFVVVHMHAVTVHVSPEVMTCAMQNPFPEPGTLEHVPGRAVDLPSAQVPLIPGRFLRQRRCRVPRLPNGLERIDHLGRYVFAREPHPRNIGEYRMRVVLFLRPEVQQHQLVFAVSGRVRRAVGR